MHPVQRLTCSFQKWIGIAAAYPSQGPVNAAASPDEIRSAQAARRKSLQQAREEGWAAAMRAGLTGDTHAYGWFLEDATPYIRAVVRRRAGNRSAADVEDIVQDVLLALHLKRGSWNQSLPIGPWISTLTRNKIVDAHRKTKSMAHIPIDDLSDVLPATQEESSGDPDPDINGLLSRLRPQQREVVQMISVDGISVRDAASRLRTSEGAVYVTLHRAFKALAALYRGNAL